MSNKELIYRLRRKAKSKSLPVVAIELEAATALEAADKRVEEEHDAWAERNNRCIELGKRVAELEAELESMEAGRDSALELCDEKNARIAELEAERGEQKQAAMKLGHVVALQGTRIASLESELSRIRAGQEPAGEVLTAVSGSMGAKVSVEWFGELPEVGDKIFTHPAATRVPDGWQLVPKRLTDEMYDAWADDDGDWQTAWTAMLAAAPEYKNAD